MPLEELLKSICSSKVRLRPRTVEKPVVLYGAGSLGKMAKEFFNYLGMPYLYVVDKNAEGAVRPEDVPQADKKNCLLVICVVTAPQIPLREELMNQGWEDTAFFYDVTEAYRDKYPLSNGWFLGHTGRIEKGIVMEVFSSLADEASRTHYVQFLAWRKLRTEIIFPELEINNANRYFVPEVLRVLHKQEVFVDGGAHHGGATENFLRAVKHNFKEIYAFEPDEENFEKLRERFGSAPGIQLMKYALSERAGKKKFYGGFGYASKICEAGGSTVRARALDSWNIPATFLKFHLEGGELGALKGAVKTIQKYRPIIAATLYHSLDGAWEIPDFIIKNTDGYKYLMRLHSWAGTGAVFYAIPEERKVR